MTQTYEIIEVVGTSDKSFSDAVQNAVQRAARTVKDIGWVEVTEMRGRVDGDRVAEFQAGVKLGFRLGES